MGAALTAVAEASRRDANQAGAVIVVILKGLCRALLPAGTEQAERSLSSRTDRSTQDPD